MVILHLQYTVIQVHKIFVTGYVKQWKEQGIPSVWLHVPIKLSHLITEVSSLGFLFHHAHQCQAVLNLWLDSSKPNKIPLYGTHQVGVAGKSIKHKILLYNFKCTVGVVYREETDEVLVIQDKHKVYDTYCTNMSTRMSWCIYVMTILVLR